MNASPLVRTEHHGRVAVLLLDNPPVNTGNLAFRTALYDALGTLHDDVEGLVLASAGRHFYAGSDLREFDGALSEPQLPDVIRRIESLPFPVVAAVNGLALGGGFELILGCDERVADPSAEFGFPEVTFGMLPGAGGTVRCPRLIGIPATIDLVTSARRIGAEEARSLGLLTAIVPADRLVERAIEVVRVMNGRTPTLERAVPVPTRDEIDSAMAALPRRARPNVQAAAEMVLRGAELDPAKALADERALFHELRLGQESVDLRYLFFARQDAAKAMRHAGAAQPVGSVGVVGAGTMGSALARTFAAHALSVTVVDSDPKALARLEGPAASPFAGMITGSSSLESLAASDLVIEAVFDELTVKQDLLRELESLVPPDAIIVSNTSYLNLGEMSSGMMHPQRFAGLHFFNPPDRNPLVEVIRAPATNDATAATLAKLVQRLGKCGISAKDAEGFVANRIYADYRTQVEFLVEEGASPEQVDAACVEMGLAIGPFAVADMSGLDIAWARRKRLAGSRQADQRYVEIADRLCEAGRLGRKTGNGWYRYSGDARRGETDPEVTAIIEKCRAAKGIAARQVSDDEIRRRVLGAVAAGAAVVVGSGVARSASDVDVAMTEGFGFPKHLGGPLRTLSRFASVDLVSLFADVFRSDPIGYSVLAPAAEGKLPAVVANMLAQVAPRS